MYSFRPLSVIPKLLELKQFPLLLNLNTFRNSSYKLSVSFVSFSNMATDQKNIFTGKIDRFQGITVVSNKEECSDNIFKQKLEGTDFLTIF